MYVERRKYRYLLVSNSACKILNTFLGALAFFQRMEGEEVILFQKKLQVLTSTVYVRNSVFPFVKCHMLLMTTWGEGYILSLEIQAVHYS